LAETVSIDNPQEIGPFRKLDTSDRRVAAVVYLVAAAGAAAVTSESGIDLMWLTVVLPLVVIGMYQIASGRPMAISDIESVKIASGAAPFDVGHASATLGFHGLLARPVWQVLAFESGGYPGHQALVTVDAYSGEVTGTFAQSVESP